MCVCVCVCVELDLVVIRDSNAVCSFVHSICVQ